MTLTGTWTHDKTDLELTIISVHYQCAEYVKCKAVLRNKKNGIVYESKNYKLDAEFFIRNKKVK